MKLKNNIIINNYRILLYLIISTLNILEAKVELPAIFSDQMILQQSSKNAIWGTAQPGEAVSVLASWGSTSRTRAGKDGKWKVFLDTPLHCSDQTLTIKASNTIIIKDVAIGEVWLCVGQSNMGWSTRNSFEAEKESKVNLPNFRIFKSAREHWHEPLDKARDRLVEWKRCNPESAAETSAVSYYFGKTLHTELDIPIGIIVQAYAGTPIEGWMPWEIQKDDPRTQEHKLQLDQNAERLTRSGTTRAKALEIFQLELAEYNARVDCGDLMKNSFRKISPPIITKPANLGHQYPAHQFNAMIHPIRPYGIRGMIWYQGERNSKDAPQAYHYRNQLAQLIKYYRSSWHELSGGNVAADFPFQFTQLPSWTAEQNEPVEGLKAPWAVNRESMFIVEKEVPNTGMVVAIDTGDTTSLHPKNKKPIGLRHAYLALQNTYKTEIVGMGPKFDHQSIEGDAIILHFDCVGSGLTGARPGKLNSFAIAGQDKKWFWADAEIINNTIKVSTEEVPKPVAVRYAWAMNPSQRNLLYNKQGFPASPFRTDSWPLFEPGAALVTVEKPAKPEKKTETDWNRPSMQP